MDILRMILKLKAVPAINRRIPQWHARRKIVIVLTYCGMTSLVSQTKQSRTLSAVSLRIKYTRYNGSAMTSQISLAILSIRSSAHPAAHAVMAGNIPRNTTLIRRYASASVETAIKPMLTSSESTARIKPSQ